MNLPTSWDAYSIKLWFQSILQWLWCFIFDLWIPEDWMKGSVATTARGGEMPNITAESEMAFVLAHTVIYNKLLKFQDHVLRVTCSKTCPTNWAYVYVIFMMGNNLTSKLLMLRPQLLNYTIYKIYSWHFLSV